MLPSKVGFKVIKSSASHGAASGLHLSLTVIFVLAFHHPILIELLRLKSPKTLAVKKTDGKSHFKIVDDNENDK